MKKFFTSESVTEGHPDKLCDKISDAILDEVLKRNADARCAIECCAAYDRLLIMGETTEEGVPFAHIAREVIKDVGYTFGSFAYDKCKIDVAVHRQSPDIAMGVENPFEKRTSIGADKLGAGDQGMMFGYACKETESFMPLPITLAHKLAKRLEEVRKSGVMPYLRPDGKTQVTIEYEGRTPKRADTIVISAQHDEGVSQQKLKNDIIDNVLSTLQKELLDADTKYLINPTGRFVIGGPEGDSGLTGRKIIVDTYGGKCAHGGGAFSGKDATKVDRSATYMARYVCKNIVASGLADETELQLAYAIGVAKPVSIFVNTFGTGKIPDDKIAEIVESEFDLTPYGIINKLNLKNPVYAKTATYGHFGRSEFAWEQLDKINSLKKYL